MNGEQDIWINPTGGYGDILMLSGVLKQLIDKYPENCFNLVRRAIYSDLLLGHPAIKKIGYPPKEACIITTDYWAKEKLGNDIQRPYQILARLFGLLTPIEEKLYLPGECNGDEILEGFLPRDGRKIAVIAPSSASPRKMMDPMIWHLIVEKLKNLGIFIIQVGRKNDMYIKGAYSLLGLTSPRQLVSLLADSDVVISVDNFVMHAAHLLSKPAIIVWGPTSPEVYGYQGQFHLQGSIEHCALKEKCLGPAFPDNYNSKCPLMQDHCMNRISIESIIEIVTKICFAADPVCKNLC
jgi:ADP-heptose:LPS heptosyltransferase